MASVIDQKLGKNWALYNGDCVECLSELPDDSIHFTLFSPPYMGLYVYSDSPRDLGNCRSDAEFHEHFGYVIRDLFRVTKPGRIVAVDCMNVPAMKERDGYIGIKDFRGDLIARFLEAGFIFHSEVCMWKDPLIEATRTKALGLMHKQLCKYSAMSRMGLAQYILAFRKPGENREPIHHPDGLTEFYGEDAPTTGTLSHERWRRYASPVWMDIDFTRTLNYVNAREDKDERHICPMALDAIHRCLQLWSNPGELVLSPFAGIGSEGYESIKLGRQFIGFELKPSYFQQAALNLSRASDEANNRDLFSDVEDPEFASA